MAKCVVCRYGDRIEVTHFPPGADEVALVDEETLPSRALRDRWRLVDGEVVVEPEPEG